MRSCQPLSNMGYELFEPRYVWRRAEAFAFWEYRQVLYQKLASFCKESGKSHLTTAYNYYNNDTQKRTNC